MEEIQAAYQSLGLWGGVAAAVMVGIRLYRKPRIQNLLPMVLRWSTVPRWCRWILIGVVSLIASLLAALAAGTAPVTALVAAIPTAIMAVLGHKATKAVAVGVHRRADKPMPSIGADYSRSIVTGLGRLGVMPDIAAPPPSEPVSVVTTYEPATYMPDIAAPPPREQIPVVTTHEPATYTLGVPHDTDG